MNDKYIIQIYMEDGRVFEYSVDSPSKVREHAAAIISGGYRHSDKVANTWEWFPPHKILKIKCEGLPTNYYTETIRGT